MAHKTLRGGTAYEVDGGTDLVNGTVYEKDYGKTLVDGTGYEVGFGVKWNKYSTKTVTKYRWNEPYQSDEYVTEHYQLNTTYTVYKGYKFSDTEGIVLTNKETFITDDTQNIVSGTSSIQDLLQSSYKLETTGYGYAYLKRYVTVNSGVYCNEQHSDCRMSGVRLKYVGYTTTYTARVKGTTSYGDILAPEGELPESGTLIEGSVDEGYCVLQIGSTYYYYELEV